MGTRKNRPVEAVLTSTIIYVLSRNVKSIRIFLSENFQFLEVKFSIYLNRRVFVMWARSKCSATFSLLLKT